MATDPDIVICNQQQIVTGASQSMRHVVDFAVEADLRCVGGQLYVETRIFELDPTDHAEGWVIDAAGPEYTLVIGMCLFAERPRVIVEVGHVTTQRLENTDWLGGSPVLVASTFIVAGLPTFNSR